MTREFYCDVHTEVHMKLMRRKMSLVKVTEALKTVKGENNSNTNSLLYLLPEGNNYV